MAADQVFHSRSEGIPSEGVKDQYADGKAARAWNKFIGDSNQRTQNYKDFLTGILRKHGCKNILDTACGTGIDSMMLIDEGFKMVSIDASDKMLKHALKARWEKRKDSNYDEWIIEEANWETLPRDIESFLPGTQFDAVICLGNSFAHLLDEYGDQRIQMMCLKNFAKCLKPGGLLFIDHRNYDAMIDSGATPGHSIYYNFHEAVLSANPHLDSVVNYCLTPLILRAGPCPAVGPLNNRAAIIMKLCNFYKNNKVECKYPVDIKTSVLVVGGKPQLIALDYCITTDKESNETSEFRLCYYPHKLDKFTKMLDEAFDNRAKHHIYADFKPMDQVAVPGFYIHVLEKAKN